MAWRSWWKATQKSMILGPLGKKVLEEGSRGAKPNARASHVNVVHRDLAHTR